MKQPFLNDDEFLKSTILDENGNLMKSKKMPIGTVSKGRKKIAEGKWVPVKKERTKKEPGKKYEIITKEKKEKVYEDINFDFGNSKRLRDAMGEWRTLKYQDQLFGANRSLLSTAIHVVLGKNKKDSDLYFDGTDMVYKDKTILSGALRDKYTLPELAKVAKKYIKT